MMTLPGVLLLIIAHYLPALDLCQISLTSKHIGASAREALYHLPDVLYQLQGPSRIAVLAATLVRRRDLAQKIHQLMVDPWMDEVEVDSIIRRTSLNVVPDATQRPAVWMKETELVGHPQSHQ
jgi:hypothetical protein